MLGEAFTTRSSSGPVGPERAGHEVVRERHRVRICTPLPCAFGELLMACRGHLEGDTLALDRPSKPKEHSVVTRGTP